jgi:hypothetical protein
VPFSWGLGLTLEIWIWVGVFSSRFRTYAWDLDLGECFFLGV